MNIDGTRKLLLVSAIAVLAIGVASGCARKRTPADLTQNQDVNTSERVAYSNERAVIVHRGEDGSRRYYRDDSGKIYYVDTNGAVHVVDRKARVERGTAGLYYIIDDDNVTYSTDQRGRLYYRDASGREVFVEESGAGRVIDPLPILRGDTYPRIEHVRSLESCNEAWRKCTSKCDEAPGLGSKRNCLDDCDYQREQCLKPF